MPTKPPPVVVEVKIDDLLDLIIIIHRRLDSFRQLVPDAADREAIFSQMMALSKLWRRLDALRLAQVTASLAPHREQLRQVASDLQETKDDLEKVAKVIHAAARAIAIAERALKLIVP